jgi:hypothetical protein
MYSNGVFSLISEVILLVNKKFWEELIVHFPLIRHGPSRCCVCILCRGNVFREPLLNNDTGDAHTDTQTGILGLHCSGLQTYRKQGDLISLLLFSKYVKQDKNDSTNFKQH